MTPVKFTVSALRRQQSRSTGRGNEKENAGASFTTARPPGSDSRRQEP